MATLNINGQKVTVGDDFMKLSPDQQNSTVDEIAKSLPKSASPGQEKNPTAVPAYQPGGAPSAQQQPAQRGVVDKLLGLTGDRYQLWLERGVREGLGAGAELIKKGAEGAYGPTGEGVANDPGLLLRASSLGLGGAPGAAGALGLGAAAVERSAATKAALPTKEAYRGFAKEAYKQIEKEGTALPPDSITNLTAIARDTLDSKLFSEVGAPSTYKAISQIEKSEGNLAKIMDVYSALGEIPKTGGSDFAAAQLVRKAIDEQFESSFVGSMWDSARQSWRTYSQLDQIDKLIAAGERRAGSTGTGANTENAIRQNVRKILDSDEKSRGFSAEAKDQIEAVVMGSWATNTARYVGKFAPSGPVSMASTLTAGLTGLATSGAKAGATLAAAVAIPTVAAKYLAQYLTRRQIEKLEEIIRSEAPQGQAAIRAVRDAPPSTDVRALEAATPALVPGAGSAIGGRPQEYDPNLL